MKRLLLLITLTALLVPWAVQAEVLTFDFSNGIPSDWDNSGTYPWVVATVDPNNNPITGIKSGNAGIDYSNSGISATFTFVGDGSITFHAGCWGEGTYTAWDKCIFAIDGTTKFSYGALAAWDTYSYDLEAGEHTFYWNYSKDGSTHSTGDAFFLDYVEINLGVAPTCPKPTGLTVNLTPANATIADLSWTVGGAESAWVLEYGTASDFTGATSVNVSGTPIKNLTGLTPETTYYARVKADCGGDDKSDWSTAVEFTPTNSISLVINRGTNTNSQVPLYGNWADDYSRSQFIIPADSLAQMQWGKIKKLTFHSSNASKSWGNAEFDVCLKEVGSTTLSALEDWSSLTTVYHGSLSIDGNKMVISFNNNFTYMGGNLMIGINQTITGSYSDCSWYGISATGASMGGYGTSISQQNFLPKVTIDYIPGEAPSCLPVSELVASDIQAHSAVLDWTAGQSESTWKLYYKKASADDFGDAIPVASKPYTLEGLDAATAYQFKVVAVCSETEESSESAIYSFTTACDILVIDADHPYSENFDDLVVESSYSAPSSRILPNCWNAINTTTYSSYQSLPSAFYYSYTDYSHSAPNCLKFYSVYSSYSSYDPQPQYAILPQMDDLDSKQLVLYARGYNASSSIIIGRMTDPSDASTFSQIAEQTLNTTYAEYEFNLAGVNGDYIAIKIDAASSDRTYNGAYIDDIVVREAPSCLKPTELAVSNIAPNSVDLSWTANSGESEWKLFYKKANEENFTEVDNITENPYTLGGLDAATAYQFYVQAVCGASEESEASAIANFITACDAITSFPWSEDFESYSASSSGVKFEAPCWENEHLAGTGSYFFEVYSGTNGTNSTKQLRLHDMSDGTLTKLRLPEMELPNDNYLFSLDVYRNASGTSYPAEGIRIFVSADGDIEGATELAFISRNFTQADGKQIPAESAAGWYTYELPIGISGTCHIILRGESKYGSATYLDNFIVKEIPSCLKPSALQDDDITTNSAEFSWTAGASETQWQYACVEKDADPVWSNENIVSVASASVSGLNANSSYDFYVRAYCDSENQSEAIMLNFRTDCAAISELPYSYDFETTDKFACWTVVDPSVAIESGSSNSHGGSKYLKFSSSEPNIIALPQFDVELNTLRLEFWTRPESSGGNSGMFDVGYMTDLDDISTFTVVETYDGATWESSPAYVLKTIDFDEVPANTNAYIAMRQHGNTSYYYWFVDDVTVKLIPSCKPPTNLVVSDITSSGASISWTAGGSEIAWQYAYVEAGAAVPTEFEDASNPTVELTGLTANTSYDFYVLAYCSATDQSEVAMLNFRTECDIVVIDASHSFFEGFEDATFVPNCWNDIEAGSYSWSRNTSKAHSGNASAYSGYYGDIYLIMPDIQIANIAEDVLLTFWSYNSYPDDYDKNSVVLLDGVNETELWSPASVDESWEEVSINLNAYKGQTISLAFKYEGSNAHGWYVDDVSIRSNISIAINASRYATYYNEDDAYIMPEGLVGHIFNATDKLVQTYVANNVVPAGVPLVLEGNQGNYQLIPTMANGVVPTETNDLFGNNEAGIIGSATDGYVYYVLSMNASNEPESVGFYYMLDEGKGGFSMPAHKAYLKYTASSAPARFYIFNGENNATWLNSLEGVEGTVKFLHEGNIYILRDSIIYDATGRKVRELK